MNKSDTFFVLNTPEGETIHLVFHVDDLLFAFSNDDVGLRFKAALMTRFDANYDGPVHKFVGIDIKRDENSTHISQRSLAESILKEFGYDGCNPCKTPMEPHTLLTEH